MMSSMLVSAWFRSASKSSCACSLDLNCGDVAFKSLVPSSLKSCIIIIIIWLINYYYDYLYNHGRILRIKQNPKFETKREREREREKGRGVATHAPLPWDTTPGKDVVTSARTPERTEMREKEREGKREREKERKREREKGRGVDTRTPAVGHHPRQGRGYQRTHPRKEREREREEEREKGRGVATHAPLPWDTTPGKDVVASARTPERTEMREREIARERGKGRGVATHAPLPWDTTPGKDVATSARTPERTEMREREKREREEEKERERIWIARNLSKQHPSQIKQHHKV